LRSGDGDGPRFGPAGLPLVPEGVACASRPAEPGEDPCGRGTAGRALPGADAVREASADRGDAGTRLWPLPL
jgi:hypothetical protein